MYVPYYINNIMLAWDVQTSDHPTNSQAHICPCLHSILITLHQYDLELSVTKHYLYFLFLRIFALFHQAVHCPNLNNMVAILQENKPCKRTSITIKTTTTVTISQNCLFSRHPVS